MMMADKIESCGMVIGDHDSGLKMIGIIETNSLESSEPMENMIRGGLAMMEMKAKDDKRMEGFLEDYQVIREGRTIRIVVEVSNSFIIERIKKEMKKAV
jgi:hypothetical protein